MATYAMPTSERPTTVIDASRLTPEQRAILDRLAALARTMDSAVTIPGTRVSVGLDFLLGLAPGVGDTVSALVAGYIIAEAQRLGVSKATTARMVGNVVIDWAVGSIPILGDVFDATFKANVRNLRLLGIDVRAPRGDVGGR